MAQAGLFVIAVGWTLLHSLSATYNFQEPELRVQPPINLTAVVERRLGGTLSLHCSVPNSERDPVKVITIGRVVNRYDYRGQFQNTEDRALASIGQNNRIQRHSSDETVGIDGHLDLQEPSTTFLRVEIHDVDCEHSGKYFCEVSRGHHNTVINKQTTDNITVCDDTLLELTKPEPYLDPSHFVVTCSPAFVGNFTGHVTYMELRRNKTSEHFQSIAFANISLPGGRAQAFPTYTQTGVHISGGIDQSDPQNSQVIADFRLGSCEDAGSFSCRVLYKEGEGTTERYVQAWKYLPNICERGLSLQREDHFGPTDFKLTCAINDYVVSAEFSVILDIAPDTWRNVASFDRYGALQIRQRDDVRVFAHREFARMGFEAKVSTPFEISNPIGTCQDAGLYRCKTVSVKRVCTQDRYGQYTACTDEKELHVSVSELRMSACEAGAMMRRENPIDHTHTDSGTEELRCTVSPEKEVVTGDKQFQLLSLAISAMATTGGRRTARKSLASINANLNDQQPLQHGSLGYVADVTVAGQIDLLNATTSYLSVVARVKAGLSHRLTYLFTCSAVFLTQSGRFVQSLDDLFVAFSPEGVVAKEPGYGDELETKPGLESKTDTGKAQTAAEGETPQSDQAYQEYTGDRNKLGTTKQGEAGLKGRKPDKIKGENKESRKADGNGDRDSKKHGYAEDKTGYNSTNQAEKRRQNSRQTAEGLGKENSAENSKKNGDAVSENIDPKTAGRLNKADPKPRQNPRDLADREQDGSSAKKQRKRGKKGKGRKLGRRQRKKGDQKQ